MPKGETAMYDIQSTMFPFAVLLVIWFGLKTQHKSDPKVHKHFYLMVYAVGLMLLLDMTNELISGLPSAFMHVANQLVSFAFFGLSTLPPLFWMMYVLDLLETKYQNRFKYKWIAAIPVVVVFVLSFLSMWFDLFFRIDENNVYHRGSAMMVHTLILYGFLLILLVFLISRAKTISKKDFIVLMSIPLFPALGGFFQLMHFGLLLMWPLSAFSMILVYVFIQSEISVSDPLTGLSNRRAYANMLLTLDKKKQSEKMTGCIVCDVDNLKEINDRYGHHIGDSVLIGISNIMKSVFPSAELIARIGGDEFVILFAVKAMSEFEEKMEEYKHRLIEDNKHSGWEFDFSVSCGAGVFDAKTTSNVEGFFVVLDRMMYENKKRRKEGSESNDESSTFPG